jgi:hypothetical protein
MTFLRRRMTEDLRRRSGVIGRLLCEMGLCRRQHALLFATTLRRQHSGSIEISAALESAIRCIPQSGLAIVLYQKRALNWER